MILWRLCLLNLNPGFSEADETFYDDPLLREAHGKNLRHERLEYAFYFLDPRFERMSGCLWWHYHLKYLIADCGEEKVARKICCVEYFPYHSRHFRGGMRVPSQQYSFQLVENAMARGAVVVIMRGRRFWTANIPSLADYESRYVLKNPQRVTVSKNNCPDGYPRIVEALMSAP